MKFSDPMLLLVAGKVDHMHPGKQCSVSVKIDPAQVYSRKGLIKTYT